MKKKKIIIIVIALIAALLIAAGAAFLIKNSDDIKGNIASSSQSEKEDDSSDKEDKGFLGFGKKKNKKNDGSISFPYRIPQTDLVIKKAAPYDGMFFEDGSDRKVKNINAILVENTGKNNLEYFEIYLNQGDNEYCFTGSTLPAGASVLLQEKDMKKAQKGSYTSASAVLSMSENFDMGKDFVSVEDNNNGSLTVRNISNKDLSCVRVFYKLYIEEENSFVGGITYVAKIEALKKGEAREITPKHYHMDKSKIMMVRIYETAE